MKIAVSTEDGIQICGHLGHVSKFLVYEVDNGSVLSKKIRNVTPVHSSHEHHHGEHGHNHAHPNGDHHGGLVGSLSDISAVITNGAGGGMIAALKSAGIDPVITPESDPDVAVMAYAAGTLARSSHGCRSCGGGHH
jgi:predicted Fe-Mo cluster-binding NifX family protein